jgi:hypothetical protein
VGGLETIGHGVFEHHHRLVKALMQRWCFALNTAVDLFGVLFYFPSSKITAMYQNSSTVCSIRHCTESTVFSQH